MLAAEDRARLRGTADYANTTTRPALAGRVMHLLDALQNSEAMRTIACERIGEALASCDDRVILQLNDIEVALRVHEAESQSNPDVLRQLGLAMMKLDIVRQHAARKCQTLGMVDAIEVYLAYETRLRDALGLPVSTQHMLFERCAQVTDSDLRAAQDAAQRDAADVTKQEAYLTSWEPWQTHLRRQEVQAFDYHKLPAEVLSHIPDKALVCSVTQEPLSQLDKPICCGTGAALRVFEAEDFLAWWQRFGTHPEFKQRLLLKGMRRVERPA